ncbi:MAG: 30S ribosome-binding factor RbfA [Acidobacteriota bacterium]
MAQHRTQRVADLIQREITDLLLREVRDPRMKLATVSGVEVSGDLGHATVRISYLGEEDAREECLDAIRGASGFFRSALAPKLQLRRVPELKFVVDRGAEHSQRIHELLEELDP